MSYTYLGSYDSVDRAICSLISRMDEAGLAILSTGSLIIKKELEPFLNEAGYVPFLSSITAIFRYKIGILEAGAGAVLGTYFFSRAIFQNTKEAQDEHLKSLNQSLTSIFNGMANIVRSHVEIIPFLGNALTSMYDQNGYQDMIKAEVLQGDKSLSVN